ncbi:MAG: SLC13/DASS family transporter [Planctomycetota bacterium]|nr:MAG: SLC13/DASS family transporter [Planctomycetota bacterium]
MKKIRIIGFILGILAFIATLIFFKPLPDPQKSHLLATTLATTLLIAAWWITEALPLAVTALVPLFMFPLLGILKSAQVSKQYMNRHILLLLGGFMIALAMEKWGLHKRIAFWVIQRIGEKPKRLVLSFMLASAFLSMWISNTATALMMLPIGLSIIVYGKERNLDSHKLEIFAAILFLAIAYGANIGGMGTLIGTPPNLILVATYEKYFPHRSSIDFVSWLTLGIPVVLAMLALLFSLFHFFMGNLDFGGSMGGKEIIGQELEKMGPITREEKAVGIVFLCTALLWISRKGLELGTYSLAGWGIWFPKADDTTVAIGMAFLLFLIPTKKEAHPFLLEVDDLNRLPWGILLLFGGGFALAEGFRSSGLSVWVGQQFYFLEGLHPFWMTLSICLVLTFLTEVTSNTVTTQLILPLLASMAITLKIQPLLLMVPATLSASCAFMLPVATMPNAIVFGTGWVPIQKMVKIGLIINLLGALVISLMVYFLGPLALGY